MNRLLACYILLAPFPLASQSQGARVIAFVDVNVVPMDSERVLTHQTVVVRGDRIMSIGPTASAALPRGAQVVQGRGVQWLMPGLSDMHSHVVTPELFPAYLANGVTSFLNLGDHSSHELLHKERLIASAGGVAPTIYAAFRLEGPGGNQTIVRTTEEARQAVRYAARNGYQFIKVYNRLGADVLAAIGAEAARLHLGVVGHGVRSVGILGGFRLGESMIAHAEEFLYTEFQKDADSGLVSRTVAATREAGAWVTPNLVAFGIMARQWGKPAVVDTLVALPEARYLSPRALANWRRAGYDTRTGSLVGRYQFLQHFTRQLQQAGVPLLVGTDAPDIPGIVPGFSVHDDLAELVRAGLTPYQALVAGTRSAGEFVRRFVPGDRFGVIAPGARADLVLLDANPLEDIANARQIAGVVVRGRWLERTELAQRQESVAVMMQREAGLGQQFLTEAGRSIGGGVPVTPQLEETMNGVGYDLLDQKKVANAVNVFERLVKRFPGSPNAHESLCEGYLAAADTVRAVRSCRAALRLDPWNSDAANVLKGLPGTTR